MSDSHGYDDRVEKIISDNKDADYFYHLGDICTDYSHNKLNIIQGNNDYDYYPRKIVAQFEGFKVHPAFKKGDTEIDYFEVGAYKTTAGHFSKSGLAPLVNITRDNFRSFAKIKGT